MPIFQALKNFSHQLYKDLKNFVFIKSFEKSYLSYI